jgi:hypothetical protein
MFQADVVPEFAKKWNNNKMSLWRISTLAYAKLFEQAREDNGTARWSGMDG